MNQFKKHEEQLKIDKDVYIIAQQLDNMLNQMWCIRSFEEGYKIWRDISSFIDEPFRNNILVEIHHVMLKHGIKQARIALKDEVEKYIIFLIEEYCQ